MREKVKILLVGAAFSADLHSDGYARIPDRVEIVGIVDKAVDRAHALAEKYGFKNHTLYDDFEKAIAEVDCDVVDVCLPNFLHHAVTMTALKKGRDVICEKPSREMVETAQALGRHIYYAEDWLGSPALRKARELIDSGAIGELKFVRARECHSGSHSPFAQTIEYCGGGAMVHLGVHPVGFMLALKNNRWKELVAMTSGGEDTNLIHKTMEGEDWAGALIRFEDGTVAVLEANYVTSGGMEDQIDFYGTKGCLHVDLTFSSAIEGFSIPGFDYTVEKAEITTGWSKPAVDERYNLGYVAEINHFVDCVAEGREARIGLRGVDGLETLEVINLVYKSNREGLRIMNRKLEK